MRIVVSGGGTAGHISPILATSDALKLLDSHAEILYIGQAGGMEAKIAAASGLEFAPIQAGKFRRYHNASRLGKIFNLSTLGLNARDATRVAAGVAGSLRILRRFKPDVVFVKGGFVGLPVGLAAHILRIPYVIHESDVSPGLTNRVLARWADQVAVGFPVKSYSAFDPDRLVFTGNPVRTELSRSHRLEGLAAFNFTDQLPVILVTGGSQGAEALNNVVLDALPELLEQYQVIHLTGEQELPRVQFELGRMGTIVHSERYQVRAFLHQAMGGALAAADLVISRAGANTIAELATLAKPTVLIPNYLMAGHQVENAKVLARRGAARVLTEQSLTPARLMGEIGQILGNPEEAASLSRAIAQFATPDAGRRLAEVILSVGGWSEGAVTRAGESAV